MRRNGFNVYFTSYGDVYAGNEFTVPNFSGYKLIVPLAKGPAYIKLSHQERTIQKIKEYGWLVPEDAIVQVLDDILAPRDKSIDDSNDDNNVWKPEYERKYLFIIGAGASAYCLPDKYSPAFKGDLLKPPLGNELFKPRFKNYYDRYKGVKLSLSSLLSKSALDIESLFEKEWNDIQESNNDIVMSRHINIQYYLQEILRDVSRNTLEKYYSESLFARFCDSLQKLSHRNLDRTRILKRKFAFVTFNQDTILDGYLQDHFGKKLLTFDNYVEKNDSPFCLFKPHGSWNWGWRFPNNIKSLNIANALFENRVNLFRLYYELLGGIEDMVDWSSWSVEYNINEHFLGRYTINKRKLSIIPQDGNLNNYYPALLLPYRDKDEFIIPPKHYYTLQHYLTYIETIIIIGWKGNEAAFNRLLLRHKHSIKKIVADPYADVVEKNLESLIEGCEVVRYNDFEHFVEEGLEKEIGIVGNY